ncbi:EamA family transporter [Agarivorans sp. B2Z047]|uniref:DMT family transporter n=1 Tax=Agarivorans sp. B2Z047 TaxID=2652721 RepID=UPI00128CA424|nr:DMT family transporter [Agarivorans sp. B2Z047]MPW30375.1 EamA family transporter [Agarivorans sp. B2Z047]UQN42997.1 DMT family transporter [Agarivorans sp. B2Z047]
MTISKTSNIFASVPRFSQAAKGLCLALMATALFSLKGIWIKLAYQFGIDPASLMTLRMAFSLPIYLMLALYWWRLGRLEHQKLKGNIVPAALVGIAGYYLASFLDLSGLQFISAPLERVVLYAYPGFTILLAWLVYRQKPQLIVVLALPLSWLGVGLMMWSETSHQHDPQQLIWGTSLVIASAFSFAFYLVFSKNIVAKIGSQAFTLIAMIAASIAIFIHFSLYGDFTALLNYPGQVYWYAAYMALFSTVIPSFLFSEAIHRIGAQRTAISGSAGPVFTLIMAAWILGDSIGVLQIAGIGLVVVAVALLNKN